MKKISRFLILFISVIILTLSSALAQVTYPVNPPSLTEYQGGYFKLYFDNIFGLNGGACAPGQALVGFNITDTNERGKPICATLSGAASALTGSLMGEDGYIPMWSNGGTTLKKSILFQNAQGQVGLGTNNPTNKLTISGVGDIGVLGKANQGGIVIDSANDPNDPRPLRMFIDSDEIQTTWGGSALPFFINPYGGSVRIGGSDGDSIDYKSANFVFENAQNNGQVRFSNEVAANYIQSGYSGAVNSAKDLRFGPVWTAKTWMAITKDGNIGIGTTKPANKLAITNPGDIGMLSNPTQGGIVIQDQEAYNDGAKLYIDAGEIQSVKDGRPNALYLNSFLGDVLIGGGNSDNTASHTGAAYIFHNATASGQIRFDRDATANYIQSGWESVANSAKDLRFWPIGTSNSHMVLTASGSLGVGTMNPKTKLDVAGNIRIGMDPTIACAGDSSGQMRFNARNRKMEFCDGTSWKTFDMTPTGATMAFYRNSCPEWWIAANGQNGTPDLRGEFIRGLDNGRGVDNGRGLGSSQGDAIRNITGIVSTRGSGNVDGFIGAFYDTGTRDGGVGRGSSPGLTDDIGFDASRVVPTANENRPRNVALLYCMKQ